MWKREATEARWEPCDPTDLFYHELIAKYWEGGPSEETAPTIYRLCTLARKMAVKSYIIEDALDRADVVDEIDHLEQFPRREPADGSVNAISVTFLTSPARTKDLRYDLVEENEIIGQFTIITFPFRDDEYQFDRRSYVYEAVFRTPSKSIDLEELFGNALSARVKKALPAVNRQQLLNNYVPVAAELDIVIHGRTLQIPAAYFCQQNGVTSFCAHCAVRTFVRTCARKPVSTRMLNETWPSYTDPEPPLRPGVDPDDVIEALEILGGFTVLAYNLDEEAPSVLAQEGADEEYTPDQIWSVLGLMAELRDARTPHPVCRRRPGDRPCRSHLGPYVQFGRMAPDRLESASDRNSWDDIRYGMDRSSGHPRRHARPLLLPISRRPFPGRPGRQARSEAACRPHARGNQTVPGDG